jgi:hypothetical protein
MRRLQTAVCLIACVAAAGKIAAQSQTARVEKSIGAFPVASPIRVDGRLDDDAWAGAEPISDLVQQDPHVGQPVSERTEVRVLVDSEALYFGVTCFDEDRSGITARELRRDNPLAGDDRFEIVLDTFHDHRNAFHFAINPLGTQYDALITDEGQDINLEWDERWWAETSVNDQGWTAEIRIPFTTLRSRAGIESFGVNFKRFIRRKNEIAQWSGWDRDFNFLQVSQAGQLTGVSGIRTGLRLRIKPFALSGFKDDIPGAPTSLEALREIGIETMKVSLTPALTAELTVNTDFAQAEVDEAAVNLTRFPLFFPEKREFFLERAGIFEFGLGGRRGGVAERNLQMFFSRRIGLTEDRRPVPIIAGGKVTGRAAGLDVGLLNVQTNDFEGTPGSNYTVFRAKRNVLSRSNVGLFMANRQATGGDFNRVFGADANFTILKNTDIQGFLGRSITPGRDGNDAVGRFKYNWLTDLHEVFVEHLYVGPEFQHDVGFVRRTGVQRTDSAFIWEPRPKNSEVLRNFVIRGEVIYLTDIERRLLTREQIFQVTARFQNDDAARFNATNTFDRLDTPFEIADGITIPVGDYNFAEAFAELESSGKRAAIARVRYGRGDFYTGERQYVQFAPAWRPSPLLSFETVYEYNDVHLREGAFTTHVFNARVNVNLSNRWLTTTVAQYDSASRRNVLYTRLNYIFRPGDDLFVVYNQSSERGIGGQPDRSLTLKLTYSLDF